MTSYRRPIGHLEFGWKVGLWLTLLGYMFTYLSMFLSGLSMLGIVFLIKLVTK